MCRKFTDEEMVKDFKPDQFYGNWFPMWTSSDNPYLYGQCPVVYFKPWEVSRYNAASKKMKRATNEAEKFIMKSSYIGLAGLVDNERKMRGTFNKNSSTGAVWVGITQNPLKKFLNNF